jgi:hypothetical protein
MRRDGPVSPKIGLNGGMAPFVLQKDVWSSVRQDIVHSAPETPMATLSLRAVFGPNELEISRSHGLAFPGEMVEREGTSHEWRQSLTDMEEPSRLQTSE